MIDETVSLSKDVCEMQATNDPALIPWEEFIGFINDIQVLLPIFLFILLAGDHGKHEKHGKRDEREAVIDGEHIPCPAGKIRVEAAAEDVHPCDGGHRGDEDGAGTGQCEIGEEKCAWVFSAASGLTADGEEQEDESEKESEKIIHPDNDYSTMISSSARLGTKWMFALSRKYMVFPEASTLQMKTVSSGTPRARMSTGTSFLGRRSLSPIIVGLNAPIMQPPNPASAACSIMVCAAMPTSTLHPFGSSQILVSQHMTMNADG